MRLAPPTPSQHLPPDSPEEGEGTAESVGCQAGDFRVWSAAVILRTIQAEGYAGGISILFSPPGLPAW